MNTEGERQPMHKFLLLGVAALAISACSDKGANTDSKERAAEMDYDAFIPMKAGQWETKFVFTDMDVPDRKSVV